jgi:hypothetical protein
LLEGVTVKLDIAIFSNSEHGMTYMPTIHDNEILAAAIEGFEAQKSRLDARIAEIRQKLGGAGGEEPGTTSDAPAAGRKRRKMSAAARKRIADAQKKRWAAVRKESGPSTTAKQEAPKAKRRLSAAGRKRIIEATKKRWALVRAAAEKEEK